MSELAELEKAIERLRAELHGVSMGRLSEGCKNE